MEQQEEIVRLLAIQLRRSVESQAQAIEELSRGGFGPARIAELLGTTANTVNVQLAKAKRRNRPKEGKEWRPTTN
jgi:DNA-directed RNA polymerase specialized sigma24 family protein